jgi:hypothetical protein
MKAFIAWTIICAGTMTAVIAAMSIGYAASHLLASML